MQRERKDSDGSAARDVTRCTTAFLAIPYVSMSGVPCVTALADVSTSRSEWSCAASCAAISDGRTFTAHMWSAVATRSSAVIEPPAQEPATQYTAST